MLLSLKKICDEEILQLSVAKKIADKIKGEENISKLNFKNKIPNTYYPLNIRNTIRYGVKRNKNVSNITKNNMIVIPSEIVDFLE